MNTKDPNEPSQFPLSTSTGERRHQTILKPSDVNLAERKTELLPPAQPRRSIWDRPAHADEKTTLTSFVHAIKTQSGSGSDSGSPEGEFLPASNAHLQVRLSNPLALRQVVHWSIAGFRLFRLIESLNPSSVPWTLFPAALPLASLAHCAREVLLVHQTLSQTPVQHRRSILTQAFGPLFWGTSPNRDNPEQRETTQNLNLRDMDDLRTVAGRLLVDIAHIHLRSALHFTAGDSPIAVAEIARTLIDSLVFPEHPWLYPDPSAIFTGALSLCSANELQSNESFCPSQPDLSSVAQIPHWLHLAGSTAPLLDRATAVISLIHRVGHVGLGSLINLWDNDGSDDDRTLSLLIAGLLPAFGQHATDFLTRLLVQNEAWKVRWLARSTLTCMGYNFHPSEFRWEAGDPPFTAASSTWQSPIKICPLPVKSTDLRISSDRFYDFWQNNNWNFNQPDLYLLNRAIRHKKWDVAAQQAFMTLALWAQNKSTTPLGAEVPNILFHALRKCGRTPFLGSIFGRIELFRPVDLLTRGTQTTWDTTTTPMLGLVESLLVKLSAPDLLTPDQADTVVRTAGRTRSPAIIATALLRTLESHVTRWSSDRTQSVNWTKRRSRRSLWQQRGRGLGYRYSVHESLKHIHRKDRTHRRFIRTTLPHALSYLLRQKPNPASTIAPLIVTLYGQIGILTRVYHTSYGAHYRSNLGPDGIQCSNSDSLDERFWFQQALLWGGSASPQNESMDVIFLLHLAVCAFGCGLVEVGQIHLALAEKLSWQTSPAIVRCFGELPFLFLDERLTVDGAAMIILLIFGHKSAARAMLGAGHLPLHLGRAHGNVHQLQRIFGSFRG
ncbi:MAG: hypothetical protein HUU55_13070 [Myxococcales bacterium]|nr:hypothetical protein [Myxococcales bacterium]